MRAFLKFIQPRTVESHLKTCACGIKEYMYTRKQRIGLVLTFTQVIH